MTGTKLHLAHTHTHLHLSEYTHTSICQKIRIAGLYLLYWISFWQMLIINYQSIDICSFIHASDWPTFDVSSAQLIRCCALLQYTVVVSFIIGPSCLVSGAALSHKTTRPWAKLSSIRPRLWRRLVNVGGTFN